VKLIRRALGVGPGGLPGGAFPAGWDPLYDKDTVDGARPTGMRHLVAGPPDVQGSAISFTPGEHRILPQASRKPPPSIEAVKARAPGWCQVKREAVDAHLGRQ